MNLVMHTPQHSILLFVFSFSFNFLFIKPVIKQKSAKHLMLIRRDVSINNHILSLHPCTKTKSTSNFLSSSDQHSHMPGAMDSKREETIRHATSLLSSETHSYKHTHNAALIQLMNFYQNFLASSSPMTVLFWFSLSGTNVRLVSDNLTKWNIWWST